MYRRTPFRLLFLSQITQITQILFLNRSGMNRIIGILRINKKEKITKFRCLLKAQFFILQLLSVLCSQSLAHSHFHIFFSFFPCPTNLFLPLEKEIISPNPRLLFCQDCTSDRKIFMPFKCEYYSHIERR